MPVHNLFYSLFIFLCLFTTQIYADSTEDRRIMISASVFPRIIAVDENLSKKLDSSGQVHLAIIYKLNKDKADKVAQQMLRKIKNIANKKILINIYKLSDIKNNSLERLSGVFIVEHMFGEDLEYIKKYASENHIILFSPFEGDVERGVMAGIFIGSKIRPYFNTKYLNYSQVKLNPAILKVSKIYE